MAEYIDKQKLIDELDDKYSLGDIGRMEHDIIVNALLYAKPADVCPVVRCKDCRYSREPDRHSLAENAACEGVLICFVGYDHVYPSISNDVFVDVEHFCGYGEVRDG